MSEIAIVAENRTQQRAGGRRFDRPVEFVVQVGDGKVRFAVGAVGGRRYGSGVRHPHCRGGADGGEQLRRLTRRLFQYLRVRAAETELAQHRQIRPLMRWDHPLRETGVRQRLHFQQALLRRQAGIRELMLMTRGGFIAERQSGVVVRQPHQPVKVDFFGFHQRVSWRWLKSTPGASVVGRVSSGVSSEAIGQAQ